SSFVRNPPYMLRNPITLLVSLGLLLSVLLTGCGSKYDRSTPEAFAQSLVQCINNKDQDGLREFAPTKEELLDAVERGAGSEEEKAKRKVRMREEWPRMKKAIDKRIFGEFAEMIEASGTEGKDLAKIQYKSVELDEERKNEDLTMRNITVICEYEGEEVKVYVRRAAEFKSGWVMSPTGFRIR
ncbi:MAG: hypothetical protein AAF570_26630, partial [Bacteroidota bacterium]